MGLQPRILLRGAALCAVAFAIMLALAYGSPEARWLDASAFQGFMGLQRPKVTGLTTVRVEWRDGKMAEVSGSEQTLKADLVLLAMGFVSPVASILEGFGVDRDARGNAKAGTEAAGGYATKVPGVFAAGDMRRGQSLVVWAIREGRQAARAVDEFLMGFSELPR